MAIPPVMQAMLFDRPGQPLRLAELPVPEPGPEQILIKVATCGVCRTDLHIFDGELSQPKLPLILGHEIVGHVAALGPGVTAFAVDDRVGVPWLGHTDGTFAQYTVADARYCFKLPAAYSDAEAAPLL